MVIGCEPGAVGAMSGGAAPQDPIFWVLHPMFEKALHILQLSPGYRDTYDMTWVAGACYGSGYADLVPFSGATWRPRLREENYLSNASICRFSLIGREVHHGNGGWFLCPAPAIRVLCFGLLSVACVVLPEIFALDGDPTTFHCHNSSN